LIFTAWIRDFCYQLWHLSLLTGPEADSGFDRLCGSRFDRDRGCCGLAVRLAKGSTAGRKG
jgi:hypothetical protein